METANVEQKATEQTRKTRVYELKEFLDDIDRRVFKYRQIRKLLKSLEKECLIGALDEKGFRGSHLKIKFELGGENCTRTLVRGHGCKPEQTTKEFKSTVLGA